MAASEAEEEGQLIPGLSEDIVLVEVVPRLPWYTRPLCRALSKSWKTMLDTRNPDLDLRTRMIQLLPLLSGLFLFCTLDKQIFIRDNDVHESYLSNLYQIQPHWRKLPPLELGLSLREPICVIASSGMVYVWACIFCRFRDPSKSLSKLDLGCADWTWKKVSVPWAFIYHGVSYNGKIYARGICPTESESQKGVVLEHDMMTDICRVVEMQKELRVLSIKSASSNARVEEMYGVEGESFEENGYVDAVSVDKLRIWMYDAGSDSWRIREEVLVAPSLIWLHPANVHLLNSDCFEPAPETGINIVWYNYPSRLLYWFNSSVGIIWVRIEWCLVAIEFIRGSIYGVHIGSKEIEEEEDTKQEGSISGLPRRMTLMQGRIILESRSVVWEEVHDTGFFLKGYAAVQTFGDLPMSSYTVMV